QNIVPRDRYQAVCMGSKENLPERVEDGGANIPVDDSAGPHDEQRTANAHQCASVGRMLVRCSPDRGIKQPHHSSLWLWSMHRRKGVASPSTQGVHHLAEKQTHQ